MEPWKAGTGTRMSCKAMNPWLFVTLFTQTPVNDGWNFYPRLSLGAAPCRLISWTCCWVLGLERGDWAAVCACCCGSSEALTHFGQVACPIAVTQFCASPQSRQWVGAVAYKGGAAYIAPWPLSGAGSPRSGLLQSQGTADAVWDAWDP